MKPGDLVRLRSDIDFPVDLYSNWGSNSIIDEVGEMSFSDVGLVLEFTETRWRLAGVRVSVAGITGWTYAEFLEEIRGR